MLNSNIKIDKKVINDNILKDKNIFFISQLMEGEHFLSFRDFSTKYDVKINFIRYNSIISSIHTYLSRFNFANQVLKKCKAFQPLLDKLIETKKCSQLVFRKLIKKRCRYNWVQKVEC